MSDAIQTLLPDRVSPVTQAMFDEIYGASLICCQIMLVLYGIASLQTYMFYLNYTKDSKTIKFMVFWMWCLSTIHAGFISHTVYHYLVKSYSNPMSLIDGEWSVYSGTVVGVIICFSIQIFFARMIFLLTKGKIRVFLTTSFILLILAQIGLGIFFSYQLFHLWELLALHAAVYPAMVPLFTIRVVSDALTAVTLCIILYDSRGFSKSIKLVRTLIIYAMNRFVLTTAVVIVQTIVLIVRPHSIWAMVIEFLSAQLYVNSFLATLNSRNRLRQIGGSDSLYLSEVSTSPRDRRSDADPQTNIDENKTKPSTSSMKRKSRKRRATKHRETYSNFTAPKFRRPSFESTGSPTDEIELAETSRRTTREEKVRGSEDVDGVRTHPAEEVWIDEREKAVYVDTHGDHVSFGDADDEEEDAYGVYDDIESKMQGGKLDFGEAQAQRLDDVESGHRMGRGKNHSIERIVVGKETVVQVS